MPDPARERALEERRSAIRKVLREHRVAFTSRLPVYRHQVEAQHEAIIDDLLALPFLALSEGEEGERVGRGLLYRCVRCGDLTTRDYHCFEKGPPLIPQMDDYARAEPVVGVFIESRASSPTRAGGRR